MWNRLISFLNFFFYFDISFRLQIRNFSLSLSFSLSPSLSVVSSLSNTLKKVLSLPLLSLLSFFLALCLYIPSLYITMVNVLVQFSKALLLFLPIYLLQNTVQEEWRFEKNCNWMSLWFSMKIAQALDMKSDCFCSTFERKEFCKDTFKILIIYLWLINHQVTLILPSSVSWFVIL